MEIGEGVTQQRNSPHGVTPKSLQAEALPSLAAFGGLISPRQASLDRAL